MVYCSDKQVGVDLNRNYGIDWNLTRAENDTKDLDCSEFYGGAAPFSEKETQAIKNFVQSVSSELRFVINFHSWGPAFIWPFNGRFPNDIERRAPKVLPIM